MEGYILQENECVAMKTIVKQENQNLKLNN